MPSPQGESSSAVGVIYGFSGLLFVFALFTLRKVYMRWHRASSVPILRALHAADDTTGSPGGGAVAGKVQANSVAVHVAVAAV